MRRERLVLRGRVTAVCAGGDDTFAATNDGLFRIDRRGDVHLLAKFEGHYPLDLLVTEYAIFWTEQIHPMQAAWRRRACAVDREGGDVRALTGETSWTAGFVRARDVVIGATVAALVRFSIDGRRRLDDLHVSPGSKVDDTDPRLLGWLTTIDVDDHRVRWSTHREISGVSRICSIALEGGDVRVERESRAEDLVLPGRRDEIADWKQRTALAGGIRYEIRTEGLVAADERRFWDWTRWLG